MSQINTQQCINFKLLYAVEKVLKFFEDFITFVIHSFKTYIQISIDTNNFWKSYFQALINMI